MKALPAASPGDPSPLRLAELVAALSLATDLGTGVPLEQALRTCLLAIWLADDLRLRPAELRSTHYLALLRAIGCSATAYDLLDLFGDVLGLSGWQGTADQWRSTRGDDRRLATRAARRAVTRVVRIIGPTVHLILHAHVRLPEQNPASRAQPSDHRRITSRHPVAMLNRSAGTRQAGRVDPVLDGEGSAVQWTAYLPVARLAIERFSFR